jgi:RNA polymerase sporulation-specific sigma factor
MKRRIIDEVKRSKKLQNIVFLDSLETLTEQKDLDAGMIFLDEQKELLQKISGVLSDLEFRVFTLYLNGMSSGEICDLTGKSAKSVDNALQRSKSKLLKFMDKKEK